jgi:metal-dependent amidase/aminoacylase/carboxypeptidase family protein
MIADGLFNRFPKPDVILGQHVVNKPAGSINCPLGAATSTGDSLKIRMIGRGSHGAMPENSIDPVVMAASTVMRLQTIVSRETTPAEAVILTIGSLQAGTKENIIPDEAILKVNVRTYAEKIRQQVLAAIERIVKAEALASCRHSARDHNHFHSPGHKRFERNAESARRIPSSLSTRSGAGRQTNPNERGFRGVQRPLRGAGGILVHWKQRPGRLCEVRRREQAGRPAHQP